MSDRLHQDINPTGSDQSKTPATIASAATIAPETFLSYITGTVDIATITPPTTGHHMLVLKFTDAAPPDLLDTGNIKTTVTTIAQNNFVILLYDPIAASYESIVSDTLASV